jgi:hypothetical protein
MTDYNLAQGESYLIPLYFYSNGNTGSPVNISNYLVYMTARSYPGASTAVLSKLVSGAMHTSPTNGSTQFFLAGSPDMQMAPGQYVYDMRYNDGGSGIATFDWGILTVGTPVTRL